MLKNTILALGLTVSVLNLHAQSFFESFDAPGTLTNNFNVYQNTTPPVVNAATGSPYSQSLTGGVGGSGSVSVSSATGVTQDATLIQRNTVFDFSHAGVTLTVASWLNVSTQTAGGNRLLQLGFVNESTNGLNGNAGIAFTSLRLSSTGTSGNIYTPQWQTKNAADTAATTTGLTPNLTLTVGDWYELEGSFQNLGGGKILSTGFLQDYGTSGVIPGSIVYAFPSTTLTSADIASDPTVYAALRGFKNDGLNTADNFLAASAIPEPGTVSLVLLGLAAFAARARKQKN